MSNGSQRISVKFESKTLDRVKTIAEEKRRSASAQIAIAVEYWLDKGAPEQ